MSDLLRRGANMLKRTMQAGVSRTITYRRAATEITLTATVGSKLLKVADDYGGARIIKTDRDYIFAADQLVIGSSQVEPQAGDQIDDSADADGVERTFEVRPPAPNEPCWQWLDHHRVQLRVHCVEVDS